MATDVNAGELGGAISPGGVGFDINCGVRLCSLDVEISDIEPKSLVSALANHIPAGATSKGGVQLDETTMASVLSEGRKPQSISGGVSQRFAGNRSPAGVG